MLCVRSNQARKRERKGESVICITMSDNDLSAEEQQRFDALMDRVLEPYQGMPQEVRDRIYSKLSADFEHPKVSELEFLLREKFTAARARFVLFFPDAENFGRFFPNLVADPPHGADKTHPQVGWLVGGWMDGWLVGSFVLVLLVASVHGGTALLIVLC